MHGASPAGQRAAPAGSVAQLEALAQIPLERTFEAALAEVALFPLRPLSTTVLQINLGKRCNLSCRHCHVGAGPDRPEVMTRATMQACVAALARTDIPTVDLTGGAPELNPNFRWLVAACRGLGREVIDRCNLAVFDEPGCRDLPEFLAQHQVELVCSLPHYRKPSTDALRGAGVFERSLAGLRRLNGVGYGDGHSGLRLVLMTNPVGAFLAAGQASLEREWKREMLRLYGIHFDALHALTNMPVGRFLEWLLGSNGAASYVQRLAVAFNPAAAERVMCRTTISVGWDGQLYDCDFNQMLELPVEGRSMPRHVQDFDAAALAARHIRVASHCFGCTAGAGSSCGGTTV